MVIDYSRIAQLYDNAIFRKIKQNDLMIKNLANYNKINYALDLACGTGNYLIANKADTKILNLIGLDMSFAMLEKAKKKGLGNLINGNACEDLPFRENTFDFIGCRYAFHHFEDKYIVIDEIYRCLKIGGTFYLLDVDPHTNKKWWVYILFPEIIKEDKRRFMPSNILCEEFKKRYFKVRYKIKTGVEIMSKKKLLERLYTRDTSQLHMVSDLVYHKCISDVSNWPSNKNLIGDYPYNDSFSFLFL